MTLEEFEKLQAEEAAAQDAEIEAAQAAENKQ